MQMILSFELPFALVPLLKFTSSSTKMGQHANSKSVRREKYKASLELCIFWGRRRDHHFLSIYLAAADISGDVGYRLPDHVHQRVLHRDQLHQGAAAQRAAARRRRLCRHLRLLGDARLHSRHRVPGHQEEQECDQAVAQRRGGGWPEKLRHRGRHPAKGRYSEHAVTWREAEVSRWLLNPTRDF